MKNNTSFFIIGLIFWTLSGNAQDLRLQEFNQQRLRLTEQSMYVLGAWGLGNLGLGLILQANTDGSARQFHQMNLAWGAINLGIAGLGWHAARKARHKSWNWQQSWREEQKIQQILLLNTGLDVAYMATGFYLLERSENSLDNSNRWKGWGQSLILQGAFLFVFDLATFWLHAKHQRKLNQWDVQLIGSNHGMGIQFQF
ncbi:MAG: hypothetical protein AAGD05_09835 [Bacteroidota bacterium]